MEDHDLNDVALMDTRSAAQETGLHADYIARLARQKRIRGKRIGNKWHVDPVSLKDFLLRQIHKEALRQEELKQQRKEEYELSQRRQHSAHAGNASRYRRLHEDKDAAPIPVPAAHAHNLLAHAVGGLHSMTPGLASHIVSPVIHPAMEFLHKVSALLVAITLVFGVYSAFDSQFRFFACSSLIEAPGALFEAGRMAFQGHTDETKPSSAQFASASYSLSHVANDICTSTIR
jgi:hypothetical protein